MYTHARCCPTHARGPVANGMNAGPLNLTFNPPSHASREPVSASPDVGTPSALLPSTSASPALNDVRRVRSVAHSRLDTSHRFGTKTSPAFPKRSGRGARRGATRQPRTLPVTSNPRGSHHHRQVRRPARASAPRTAPPGGAVRFRGAPPRAPALVRSFSTPAVSPRRRSHSPTRDTPVASTHTTSCNPSPVMTCGSRVKLARSVAWVLTSDASRSSAHDSVAD